MATTIFGDKPNPAGAFSSASAGVSDIFAGFGDEAKQQGDILEQGQYLQAVQYAYEEAQATKQSTAIQEMQQSRDISKSLGQTTADVAGAGFATSGSALDLLRESASQGALQKQVTQEQGNITEMGYREQQQSYQTMAAAAGVAAGAEGKAAEGAFIGAGISFATSIAQMPLGA
jgi:hypothetical protein